MGETLAIVTWPRGSWRWQNAYKVARYITHTTRSGVVVWRNAGYLTGKCSLPQLRRMGYGEIPMGGLHMRPVQSCQERKVG